MINYDILRFCFVVISLSVGFPFFSTKILWEGAKRHQLFVILIVFNANWSKHATRRRFFVFSSIFKFRINRKINWKGTKRRRFFRTTLVPWYHACPGTTAKGARPQSAMQGVPRGALQSLRQTRSPHRERGARHMDVILYLWFYCISLCELFCGKKSSPPL